MKFFHYLFENHPGVGHAERVNESEVAVALFFKTYQLPIDHRDQRVLVVIDGELLWESIPKAGDVIHSAPARYLSAHAEHLRKSRFGLPSYTMHTVDGRSYANLELLRHFLLLPCGNAVFRRFRDERSLGPQYVFVEVHKDARGPSVTWRNSSY